MSTFISTFPVCRFLGSETSEKKSGPQFYDIAQNYTNLVSAALVAIDRVCKRDIPDPTVGENACQFRAGLFAEFINSEDFSTVIETAKKTLEKAQEQLEKTPPSKKDWNSLDAFLKANDAVVVLDKRVALLTAAHLLTLTREPQRSFSKDSEGVVQPCESVAETDGLKKAGFGTSSARKVGKTAKQFLAEETVQFLKEKAKTVLPEQEGERLYKILSEKTITTSNPELHTAPCFSGTQVLLANACQTKTPLVVKIHQLDAESNREEGDVTFFFTSDGTRFQPSDRKDIPDRKAVIGLDAISVAHPVLSKVELEKEIFSRDIRETLLAFIATHPVYGGDKKREPGPNEEDSLRKEYTTKALTWGCSPANPRVCRFYHTYPAFLEKPYEGGQVIWHV